MIRPTAFARDDQAAETNAFMNAPTETAQLVQERAAAEFDALAAALEQAGVHVLVVEDNFGLPDSVFPNNWISFHQPIESIESDIDPDTNEAPNAQPNAQIITYPMLAKARRKERRDDILDIVAKYTHTTPDHLDLSGLEDDGDILEGTGSLVLDRVHNTAYACMSGRTTENALDIWEDETGYQTVRFHSADREGNPVYHTNVVMSIGTSLAVVCLESITDPDEYELVEAKLNASGRVVMPITLDQVANFCGNILELESKEGQPVFAMSQTAYEHFSDDQRAQIEKIGTIVHSPIPTIEFVAGGSVRCMIAELGKPD